MQRALGTLSVLVAMLWSGQAGAHCQVPCGIYDDAARVKQMREDVTTIEKAIKEISQLASKRDPQSSNQLVRWIVTKEQHADKIIHIIADYFLTQKIKPATGKGRAAYLDQLARHHAVMVGAMKCKQSANLNEVQGLKKALDMISNDWK